MRGGSNFLGFLDWEFFQTRPQIRQHTHGTYPRPKTPSLYGLGLEILLYSYFWRTWGIQGFVGMPVILRSFARILCGKFAS